VATFSGGMVGRLDLAMTLMGNSGIFFLDEPTTGLDPRSRRGMWQIIRELAAGGVTIFLTTQYVKEARPTGQPHRGARQRQAGARGDSARAQAARPGRPHQFCRRPRLSDYAESVMVTGRIGSRAPCSLPRTNAEHLTSLAGR
jgi:ABC-2 type transport system ATP-binding protein